MSEQLDWTAIGTQAGFGFFLGLAVGYAIKKAVKVALVVIGVAVLIGIALERSDFIMINWGSVQEVYDSTIGSSSVPDHINTFSRTLAGYIPAAGGFSVGFLLGLKKG